MVKKLILPVTLVVGSMYGALFWDERQVTRAVINAIHEFDPNLTLGIQMLDDELEDLEETDPRSSPQNKHKNRSHAEANRSPANEVNDTTKLAEKGTTDAARTPEETPSAKAEAADNLEAKTDTKEETPSLSETHAKESKPSSNEPSHEEPATRENKPQSRDEELEKQYYEYHHDQMTKLVNVSTTLDWNRNRKQRGKYRGFLDAFDYEELGKVDIDEHLIANSTKYFLRSDGSLCDVAKGFHRYRVAYPDTPKPHILLGRLNQDFGVLSSAIRGKTGNFKKLPKDWIHIGCTFDFVMDYINHTDTLAIFTTQFQKWSIPKVISIPLGLHASTNQHEVLRRHIANPIQNRTKLLMINFQMWMSRRALYQHLWSNFQGHSIRNTYKNYGFTDCPHAEPMDCYYWEMAHSKFVLSPSGLGVDCYRTWESIYMGAIPVVERLNKHDGWFENTLADLPIAWIDNIRNVTPDFLMESYDKLIHKTPPTAYKFEKMTRQYWHNMAYSILEEHVRKVKANGGVARKIVRPELEEAKE